MSRRLATLVVTILCALLLVGGVSIAALALWARTARDLSRGYGPAITANDDTLELVLGAASGLRTYALTGRGAAVPHFPQVEHEVAGHLAEASAAVRRVGDPALLGGIAREQRLARSWLETVARPAAAGQDAAHLALESPSAEQLLDRFRTSNSDVGVQLRSHWNVLAARAARERVWLLPLVSGVLVLAVVLTALVALRTARAVSRPLTAVWRAVRQLESGDLTARADELGGPAEVRAVSAAVNSLAVERRRAEAGQRADEQLRREVRSLTAAIRMGQDPATIARTLAAGLGRVFNVDRVWLRTFDEERVAIVAEQWVHGERMALVEPSAVEITELRWLASRLWHGNAVAAISDAAAPPPDVDPHVLRAPLAAGATASVVVSVGEGGKAIGLLWLSTAGERRLWTSTELGLLQHVAAELAQNLVQNHVLDQQREAMRRLREADEAKTALVSTVSHELRTPLTSIIGYLDVLLDTDTAGVPDEVRSMLRVIDRNAKRLQALIEDLLTQSQIEAGRRLVELDRVDLVDVLAEVVDMVEPLADNAHLHLEVEPPARGVVIVDGDARQLTQAIGNLASNAVKFTPRGGRVRITAWREAADGRDEALVRVSDTGIGIPADELPRLFERFYRATNARRAVIQGTGLGLAIVREIVSQHHGTVQVESDQERGTAVTIRLPVGAEARR